MVKCKTGLHAKKKDSCELINMTRSLIEAQKWDLLTHRIEFQDCTGLQDNNWMSINYTPVQNSENMAIIMMKPAHLWSNKQHPVYDRVNLEWIMHIEHNGIKWLLTEKQRMDTLKTLWDKTQTDRNLHTDSNIHLLVFLFTSEYLVHCVC